MSARGALVRAATALLLGGALALGASPALAQNPAPGFAPEQLVLRVDEFWLRPILEVRERGEIRLDRYELDAFTGTPFSADRYSVEHRVRLGAEARWRMLRAFVVLRDARRFGDAPGLESGTTDLYQAFMEVRGEPGWLRVGRQEIRYGSQRMVGARPWGPGQSFDALRGHLDLGDVSLDAFGAWIEAQPGGRDLVTGEAISSPGRILSAAKLTWVASSAFVLQPSLFYLYDGPYSRGGVASGPEDRHLVTAALRAFGRRAGWRYDLEVFGQTGQDVFDEAHLAFAGAGWVGYQFRGDARIATRLGGSFGTGRGTDIRAFDNTSFPTNHGPYGILDNASLNNLASGFARLAIAPRQTQLTAFVDFHLFFLPEPGQPWRGQDGRSLGQGGGDDPLLGGEVDLVATWRPDPSLQLQLGYALFVPGPAANAAGQDELSQMLYLALEARLP